MISGFAIDLIMAVMFLVDRKRLPPELKVPIALFKLIGDLCGGIYYGRNCDNHSCNGAYVQLLLSLVVLSRQKCSAQE